MPDFKPTSENGQEAKLREANFGADFDIVAALDKEEKERREKYDRDTTFKRAKSGGATAGGVTEGGSEEEIARRMKEGGGKRAEEGGQEREDEALLSEKDDSRIFEKYIFEPSPYIVDAFQRGQRAYDSANEIFNRLKVSDRLTDEQLLELQTVVGLVSDAETTWNEARELQELERSEFPDKVRRDVLKKVLERRATKLGRAMDEIRGRSVNAFIVELGRQRAEGGISPDDQARLKGVLVEAWEGSADPEAVLNEALTDRKISKPEFRKLESVLNGMWPAPAMTIEEMVALRPKIDRESKAREKTNKVRRNILAYVYELERVMWTPKRKEESEEAEDSSTRAEEIRELSKEIRTLRKAAKSDDPRGAVREAFAEGLTLEDYDAIEKSAAVLRRGALGEEVQGEADVAGLLEALAIKAIDEDMPAAEFSRLKEEIIRGGGVGKSRGAARPEVEVQGRRIENNDARVLYSFIQSKDLPPQDSGRLLGIVEGLGDAQDFTASLRNLLKRSEILKRDFDVIRKLQKEIPKS